ncbi:MAG: ABC-ATPase domain-containing protein, partial [Chloroflexota bacterium]
RVRVVHQQAQCPSITRNSFSRRRAFGDFLSRVFSRACQTIVPSRRGSGKSGLISMPRPGQEILARSSVVVTDDFIEARFVVGLPAQGRRVLGRQAQKLFVEDIPKIVNKSLYYQSLNADALTRHLNCAEDADHLRHQLSTLNLVAFVANGSCLPRRTGTDDRPLTSDDVVLFESPKSLEVEFELPHQGSIVGMGIPKGVTLIVGGGYHGKSTLLNALERGIYNHIPGDGREWVITEPTAVKVRAEDGRHVAGVDISPFINHLPNGVTTTAFSTDNASGSTSQAANIVEALDMGAQTLLLDEDTCATNFMIRDARMQALVAKSSEPITPFVDRVRRLATNYGFSSILVLGGSGDYFDVADTVIQFEHFRPKDVTDEAKLIAQALPTGRWVETSENWTLHQPKRFIAPNSLNPRKGKREFNIRGHGQRAITFGVDDIDVSLIAQIVDDGQVNALGQALGLIFTLLKDPSLDVGALVTTVIERVDQQGLDALDSTIKGDYVQFRRFELAAVLNRLRTLQVKV